MVYSASYIKHVILPNITHKVDFKKWSFVLLGVFGVSHSPAQSELKTLEIPEDSHPSTTQG